MRRQTAQRLVGRAERRRSDGKRGLQARWGLRRLERAAGHGDRMAVGALWGSWLRDPDEGVWAALEQMDRPVKLAPAEVRACSLIASSGQGLDLSAEASRAELVRAAERLDHPLGGLARQVLDELWASWLEHPDEEVWATLVEWGRPAESGDVRELSVLALSPASPSSPVDRQVVVEALGRKGHPITGLARRLVVDVADLELVEAVVAAAEAGNQGAALAVQDRWRTGPAGGALIEPLVSWAGRTDPPKLARRTVDRAWERWFESPGGDERLWHLLSAAGQPASKSRHRWWSLLALGQGSAADADLRRAVVSAGELPGAHPLSEMARDRVADDEALAEALCRDARQEGRQSQAMVFCLDNGLVPADPVRRVVFLLVSGQGEQLRAADPDGSLLAAAYRAAGTEEKARLRAAAVTVGQVDAVRVLSGAAGRIDPATMRDEEVGYLVDRLVEQADWERLWGLVRQLSLLDALEVIPRFGAGWSPSDELGRAVWDRMRTADRHTIAVLGGEPQVARFDLSGVGRAAVSPDGHQIAVVRFDDPADGRLDVLEVPSGAPVASIRHPTVADSSGMWSLGQGCHLVQVSVAGPLWLIEDGQGRPVDVAPQPRAVSPTASGFVVLERDWRLVFFDRQASTQRVLQLEHPGLGEFGPPRALAVEGRTGTVAVGAVDGAVVVADPESGTVVDLALPSASCTSPRDAGRSATYALWFTAPNQLVAGEYGRQLWTWGIDDGRLHLQAEVKLRSDGSLWPIVATSRGELACRTGFRRLDYLDPVKSQADVLSGRPLAGEPADRVFGSLDRSTYGVVGRDGSGLALVRWASPAAPLARRRPTELNRADLEFLAAKPSASGVDEVRELVELVELWLGTRFATEVALGSGISSMAGRYDIAVASVGEQEPSDLL